VLLLSQERRVKKKPNWRSKKLKSYRGVFNKMFTALRHTIHRQQERGLQTCISLKSVKMALDEAAKSQTQKEKKRLMG